MKNSLLVVLTSLFLFSFAIAQSKGGFGHFHGKMIDALKLTDTQQEHFDKIRYETQKKQIDLRAKISTARLDLQRLIASDVPDKSAIEKKYNEIASLQTALKMNRFNAWSENNKVLTPEQQKIWKQVLTAALRNTRRNIREMRRHRSDENIPLHQW